MLFETLPISVVDESMSLACSITRKCAAQHAGYESATEVRDKKHAALSLPFLTCTGNTDLTAQRMQRTSWVNHMQGDSFLIAFHTAKDATLFCARWVAIIHSLSIPQISSIAS